MRVGLCCLCILFFSSCMKEIPFETGTENKKIVIEGSVNDKDTAAVVTITETLSLSDNRKPTPVSGAEIRITDESGNLSVGFQENSPGTYTSSRFTGYPGHNYLLSVTIGNVTYESRSQMPMPVVLDSIGFLDMSLFGQSNYHAILYFQDPVLFSNYYRYLQKVNGKYNNSIYVFSDQYLNGRYQNMELYRTSLSRNDSVSVEMQCIEKQVYDYFTQLGNVDQSTGQQSLNPTNPVSNISGGAAGYFSAYCKQERFAVVK